MANNVDIDTGGLDSLIKAFKGKLPRARVGIIGSSNTSIRSIAANATIGYKHEFGGDGLPIRSFLRIPLSTKMNTYLQQAGFFDRAALKKVLRTHSIEKWVGLLGIIGERIVQDAFASGGFGKWKPSIMTHKKVQQTLVETGQLRNSITSDVK